MCDSLLFDNSCLFFYMPELPLLYFSLRELQIQNCCTVVLPPLPLELEFLFSVSPVVDEQPAYSHLSSSSNVTKGIKALPCLMIVLWGRP